MAAATAGVDRVARGRRRGPETSAMLAARSSGTRRRWGPGGCRSAPAELQRWIRSDAVGSGGPEGPVSGLRRGRGPGMAQLPRHHLAEVPRDDLLGLDPEPGVPAVGHEGAAGVLVAEEPLGLRPRASSGADVRGTSPTGTQRGPVISTPRSSMKSWPGVDDDRDPPSRVRFAHRWERDDGVEPERLCRPRRTTAATRAGCPPRRRCRPGRSAPSARNASQLRAAHRDPSPLALLLH